MSEQRFGRQRQGEMIALLAAITAMVALAIDSMLPAFASVRETFGLGPDSTSVAPVITVFFLGLGVGQFLYGPVSDRFGRRPVLLGSIGAYVALGFATAAAPSLPVILVLRFVWGLAAAGPRVVATAIVRDRFSGDQMAKVMSIMMAIFLIVPAIAPSIGQLALRLGSWRTTFATPPLLAMLLFVWAWRMAESLPPERRRPLDFPATFSATKEVLTNRHTLGHLLALLFALSAFLPYLASGERIYGQIYGEADRFPLWFAISSVATAIAAITASRTVERLGAANVLRLVLVTFATGSGLLAGAALLSNGVPPFWLFFLLMTAILSSFGVASALLNSIAMEPMGHIAGTASATIGTISFVSASVLSSIVDRLIGSTVTPFATSFLVYALLAIIATTWARSGRPVAVSEA
jgi:DHA1 family bicyclomycin/chloramphenicol resistance-like MFS transporter